MNDQDKKNKEPLKIPLGFEETLEAMLQVKPEDKKPPTRKAAVNTKSVKKRSTVKDSHDR